MASSAPGPCFTSGENVGLFLLAGTSGVSAIAIIGLLSYIAVSLSVSHLPNFRMSIDGPGSFPKYSAVCIRPGSSRRWRIAGPTEVYFLNQLAWDLVQAIGESWDNDNKGVS